MTSNPFLVEIWSQFGQQPTLDDGRAKPLSTDPTGLEIAALQERLSRLSQASQRINQGLDFDAVLWRRL